MRIIVMLLCELLCYIIAKEKEGDKEASDDKEESSSSVQLDTVTEGEDGSTKTNGDVNMAEEGQGDEIKEATTEQPTVTA